MIENEHPSGRLLIKRLSESMAIYILFFLLILLLLSIRKIKWKSEPAPSFIDSGFSSFITLKISWGATGSKVGTKEAEQAISPVPSALSA